MPFLTGCFQQHALVHHIQCTRFEQAALVATCNLCSPFVTAARARGQHHLSAPWPLDAGLWAGRVYLAAREATGSMDCSGMDAFDLYELPDEFRAELSPNPDVHALFQYYNQLYFDGELGACSVEWSSSRMTMCAPSRPPGVSSQVAE